MSSTESSKMWFIKKVLKALKHKEPGKYAKDPIENIIGIAGSGIKNGSVNHDRYLYGKMKYL